MRCPAACQVGAFCTCPQEEVCTRRTFQCSTIQEDDGSCGYIPTPQSVNCTGGLSANCSSGGSGPAPSSSSSSTGNGQWGSCGNCQGCGYATQYCRLNPQGQCVGDPTGCNNGWEVTCGDYACDWGETAQNCPWDCCQVDVFSGACSYGRNMCGQVSNCGPTGQPCPTSDSGSPSITSAAPTNGSTVTMTGNPSDNLGASVYTTGTQITIRWTGPDSAVAPAVPNLESEQAYISVYPSNSNCVESPDYCNQLVTLTRNQFCDSNGCYQYTTGMVFSFIPEPEVSAYTYTITNANTTCGYQTSPEYGPITFNIRSTISGTFYADPNQAADVSGNICTLSGATPTSPGTGAVIRAVGSDNNTYTGTITGSTFSINVPYWVGGNNVVTLTPGVSSGSILYACTCPNGCVYSGIASPQSGVNYFILPENLLTEAWWQVQGGSAYAGGTSGSVVYSATPDAADCNSGTSCAPYISKNDANNTARSAGLIVTGGGDIDSQRETGNQETFISEQSPQLFTKGTAADRYLENYSYFYRKFTFQNLASTASTPAGLPEGQAYFHSGDLALDSAWSVPAGQDVIVFVDGNLTFADAANVNQLMQVANGGFLAFIVSGDITIDENLGNETLTSTTTNLEGIYIADGTLTIESRGNAAGGDDRFVGAGTFVGWGGVDLQRDFRSDADVLRLQNSKTKPTELFVFRPDLVRNVPETMMSPRYIWQETN